MHALFISLGLAAILSAASPAVAGSARCVRYFANDSERVRLVRAAHALRSERAVVQGPSEELGWGRSGSSLLVYSRGTERVLKVFIDTNSPSPQLYTEGDVEALAIQVELARLGFAPVIRAWFGREASARWAALRARELGVTGAFAVRPRFVRFAVLMDRAQGISVKYPESNKFHMTLSAYQRAQRELEDIGIALQRIGALAFDVDFLVDQSGKVTLIDLSEYRFETPINLAGGHGKNGVAFKYAAQMQLQSLVRDGSIEIIASARADSLQ